MKMMSFIDIIIEKYIRPIWIIYLLVISIGLSYFFWPGKPHYITYEGTICDYVESVRIIRHARGGKSTTISFIVKIENLELYFPHSETKLFKGNEVSLKKVLGGKTARIIYRERSKYIYSIELEDGSFSYKNPHPLEYYNVGYFPFCVTAPLAVICVLVLLRYFYLLTFASDERRKLVFGDKNYNPFN